MGHSRFTDSGSSDKDVPHRLLAFAPPPVSSWDGHFAKGVRSGVGMLREQDQAPCADAETKTETETDTKTDTYCYRGSMLVV